MGNSTEFMRSSSPIDAEKMQSSPAIRSGEVFKLLAAARASVLKRRQERYHATRKMRQELQCYRVALRRFLNAILSPGQRQIADSNCHSVQLTELSYPAPVAMPDTQRFEIFDADGLNAGVSQLTEQEVLRSIESHPEGISIMEIGNELGVDWRRVLELTRTLLTTGQIDQVQQLFYPAGR